LNAGWQNAPRMQVDNWFKQKCAAQGCGSTRDLFVQVLKFLRRGGREAE